MFSVHLVKTGILSEGTNRCGVCGGSAGTDQLVRMDQFFLQDVLMDRNAHDLLEFVGDISFGIIEAFGNGTDGYTLQVIFPDMVDDFWYSWIGDVSREGGV